MARAALCALLLVGCGASHGRDDDAGPSGTDAGMRADGGSTGRDAGPGFDAGRRDGGPVGDAGADAGSDAGTPGSCDPQRARAATCPEVLCDGPSRWQWNGDDCFMVDCGGCEGEDCATSWSTYEQCMDDHAECVPTICRRSGGTWRFWGQDCGHFICGRAPPETCLVGYPSCDCGPNGVFEEGTGCRSDPELCEGPALEDETACTSTGGTWGAFCCHSDCGEPCPLFCAADACDCGTGRIFREGQGCVASAECYEGRAEGEICDGGARCGYGMICCERCGGAGCVGPARCRYPVCDDDPDIDECGNNLLAP